MSIKLIQKNELDAFYSLVEDLTGTTQSGRYRKEMLVNNVERLMRKNGIDSLGELLEVAGEGTKLYESMISAITIHTTSWFREKPHFDKLEDMVQKRLLDGSQKSSFRVWISACSTGQEAYSFGMILEKLRRSNLSFDYSIDASDIDPVSVGEAKRGVYSIKDLSNIPVELRTFTMRGKGDIRHLFTLVPDIRSRIKCFTHDLTSAPPIGREKYDLVVCRNCLIYFDDRKVLKVIDSLKAMLKKDGVLALGHSEGLDASLIKMEALGSSWYSGTIQGKLSTTRQENSAGRHLSNKVVSLPVKGSLSKSEAFVLVTGADNKPYPLRKSRIDRVLPAAGLNHVHAILIGASTGGPDLLNKILFDIPKTVAPIVVVQHISPEFLGEFAESLKKSSGLALAPFTQGRPLSMGTIYLATEFEHIGLIGGERGLVIKKSDGPKVCGHKPSVDYLFSTAADTAKKYLAFLLTGMGADGANGLKKLASKKKNTTITQEGVTCVVNGMPKAAKDIGASQLELNPSEIRFVIEKTRGII